MLEIMVKGRYNANSYFFLVPERRGMRKAVFFKQRVAWGGICVVALLDAWEDGKACWKYWPRGDVLQTVPFFY